MIPSSRTSVQTVSPLHLLFISTFFFFFLTFLMVFGLWGHAGTFVNGRKLINQHCVKVQTGDEISLVCSSHTTAIGAKEGFFPFFSLFLILKMLTTPLLCAFHLTNHDQTLCHSSSRSLEIRTSMLISKDNATSSALRTSRPKPLSRPAPLTLPHQRTNKLPLFNRHHRLQQHLMKILKRLQ